MESHGAPHHALSCVKCGHCAENRPASHVIHRCIFLIVRLERFADCATLLVERYSMSRIITGTESAHVMRSCFEAFAIRVQLEFKQVFLSLPHFGAASVSSQTAAALFFRLQFRKASAHLCHSSLALSFADWQNLQRSPSPRNKRKVSANTSVNKGRATASFQTAEDRFMGTPCRLSGDHRRHYIHGLSRSKSRTRQCSCRAAH